MVAAGIGGTIAIFFGIALIAPFLIEPLTRVLSWPIRKLAPVEGRIAADSARSNPARTAATATALMIGLALVVGHQQPRRQLPQLDRARVRQELRPRPDRAAARLRAGPGPAADDLAGRREADRAHPRGRGRHPRALGLGPGDLPRPPGHAGPRRRASLFAFDPAEYLEPSTAPSSTPTGASREQSSSRASSRGRCRSAGATPTRRGSRSATRSCSRAPPAPGAPRSPAIVETVFAGGQTVGMSLEDDASGSSGSPPTRELALKATSDDARPDLEAKVEKIVEQDYPNLTVLSNDELKSDVEDQLNQTLRHLQRARRRRDLRQPVRDHQHALDVGDRAHPRDRRPARPRLDPLADPPHDRRREPRDRPDRRRDGNRDRRRPRLRPAQGPRLRHPRRHLHAADRDRWSASPSPRSSSA